MSLVAFVALLRGKEKLEFIFVLGIVYLCFNFIKQPFKGSALMIGAPVTNVILGLYYGW